MQLFKNRPLALSACLFAVTVCLVWRLHLAARAALIVFAALAFLLALVFFIQFQSIRRGALLTMLCSGGVLLAMISSFLFFEVRMERVTALVGEEIEVEGVVLERGTSLPYITQLRVAIERVDGEPVRFDAAMEASYASALQVGDRFRIRVTPRTFENDEFFDERTYRLSDGCLCVLQSEDQNTCEIIGEARSLRVVASQINTRLAYRLSRAVGEDAGGLCSALLLGNRRFLSDDVALAFRRTGVSHLLALSGLHVSILIGFVVLLTKFTRLPKRLSDILVPALALFYLILTGCAVSTLRAVILVCFLYVANRCGESYDSFTALSIALCLILLATPYAVLDLSLWMSFLSASAIVIFSPTVYHLCMGAKRILPPWLHKTAAAVLSAFCTGFFASCALLLLSAMVFGELSLIGIPMTMLLSVPITALLVLSIGTLFLQLFTPLASVTAWLATLTLEAVSCGSEFEHVLIPVNDPYTQAVLAALTALMVLLAIGKIARPIAVLSPMPLFLLSILVSFCVTYLPTQSAWRIDSFKAGHGQLHLYSKSGVAVVINRTRGNASGDVEIHTLALNRRCTEVGDMVLPRYYNQANYFIQTVSGEIKVRRLHMPIPQDAREEAIAKRLSEEAELHGIEVHYDADLWVTAYENAAE